MMRRRRTLFKRGLLLFLFILGLVYLQANIKSPEEIITQLCHDDRTLFRQQLNLSLSCDCAPFKFLPSCSRLDSLINVFSNIGDRHKNILFLVRQNKQRVVLKYRKDMTQLNGSEKKDSFNGQPHFCPHSFDLLVGRRDLHMDQDDVSLVANMNFEVVLLKFLSSSGLPVPQFIAHCGLYLMESNAGSTLNGFYKSATVVQRLTIAKNMLLGSLSLTKGHGGFRFYLTDATRDNIAVDEKTMAVTFIDLDDVIVQQTELFQNEAEIHRHRKIECDNCFAYSTNAVCAAPTSDLNVFTICQLLLEDLRGDTRGGFLYLEGRQVNGRSERWKGRWREVQKLLRDCVYCDTEECLDRFRLAKELVKGLQELLMLSE